MLKLWRFRWRFQEILWRILALFDFNFGAVAKKNLATLLTIGIGNNED